MKRRIVVAGGTGFVGRRLTADLVARGYEVVVLTRGAATAASVVRGMHWDGRTLGDWARAIDGAFAVVNLAGRTVNTRHTAEHKKEIMESRVDATQVLGQAMARATQPPPAWVQASTLAIYGRSGPGGCDETCPSSGDDFLAEVTRRWEETLFTAAIGTTRRVALRIGFVLGRDGGALPMLTKLTRCFLGGRAGSGRQYINWIHIVDLLQMFVAAIERSEMNGAYNACAPGAVTNAQFMRQLRRLLHRPWSPPAPAWAVRLGALLLGTEADLVLSGRRCVPRRWCEQGCGFEFPELRPALEDLLANEAQATRGVGAGQ